jgi:hypothetical protein
VIELGSEGTAPVKLLHPMNIEWHDTNVVGSGGMLPVACEQLLNMPVAETNPEPIFGIELSFVQPPNINVAEVKAGDNAGDAPVIPEQLKNI